VDLFWDSLNINNQLLLSTSPGCDSTIEQLVQREMSSSITFEEFHSHVLKPRKGKATGITGLSYTKIRLLPSSVLRYVFDLTLLMFDHLYVPQWMKDNWICPLPKKSNPSMGDLRPISLVEPLRKLWLGLITKLFSRVLSKFSLLSTTQHCGVSRRSTETE
jgi:hypothetical protein